MIERTLVRNRLGFRRIEIESVAKNVFMNLNRVEENFSHDGNFYQGAFVN